MPYQTTIPFPSFRLHFQEQLQLLSPLRDQDTLRPQHQLTAMLAKYQEALQKELWDEANLTEILDDALSLPFHSGQFSLQFEAEEEALYHPGFSLEFDYYYQERRQGFWAIVPLLGVEAYAKRQELLEERLQAAARIDFARRRRLENVRGIISAIWYELRGIQEEKITLQVPEPGEEEGMQEQEDKGVTWLRKVANPLTLQEPQAYYLEDQLRELDRALHNNYTRSILIVGAAGSGKSSLIWEFARQLRQSDPKATIWETTASMLIKELTTDYGWEYNIGALCDELKQPRQYLFVRNLMALFEVGRYEGNEVSIADYLLPLISRGEIALLSECTEQELAQIEIKKPAFTSHFQRVALEVQRLPIEKIILRRVAMLASQQGVQLQEDAIRETIRLHERFTPYAGMPGRPVRFLEALLLNEARRDQIITLDRPAIIRYFCEETGMPTFMADPDIPMDPAKVRQQFAGQLQGQERAVNELVDLLGAVKTALTRRGKPIASFLFVGPTGVGKTELSKLLAAFMFGQRDRLTRFDMSEYSTPQAVLRLTGIRDGLLTAAVRREPFSVLLFDELKKADDSFFDLLLQILSEGRLTDGRGQLANFCSTIIIMTSNIGASQQAFNQIGWSRETSTVEVITHFEGAVRKHFKPELFNRIDRIIPFQPLSSTVIRSLVQREINLLRMREGIRFRKMELDIQPEVYDYLAKRGYQPQYGARYLQRSIRQELIIPLARHLNQEDPTDQLLLRVHIKEKTLQIEAQADPLGLEILLEELNKLSIAESAGAHRRNMDRFVEGFYYTLFLQEWDRIQKLKTQQGQDFWKHPIEAQRYPLLQELQQRSLTLQQEINDLEIQLDLMALDMSAFRPHLEDELKDWSTRLLQAKLDLYATLEPQHNICYLGIYGREILPLHQFYLGMLDISGHTFSSNALWYRNEDGHYYTTVLEGTNFRAEQPGDRLIGVEYKISGSAAFLFWSPEAGGQRWSLVEDQEEERIFDVRVEKDLVQRPARLHRQAHYKNLSVRRSYLQPEFHDSQYKLGRELTPEQLPAYVYEELREQFQTTLEQTVN